ncbi:MAG: RDD family protein [Pirellulales bacterium]
MVALRQIDTTVGVVTPENVAFEYRVAGPFRRSIAYLLDLMVRLALAAAIALIVNASFSYVGLAGFGWAVTMITLFILMWFYGPLMETYWNGQTIGKRLLRLRVLTVEGQPINGLQATARNLLRFIDAQPIFFMVFVPTYLLGVAAAMCNRRFQRLGDLASGTMVVIEERSWVYGLVRIEDPAMVQLAGELPPKYDVSRSLGQALAAYVERRRYFSPARRADISRHVGEPLRVRFGLPPQTSHDLLLCALYFRTFVTDRDRDPYDTGLSARLSPDPSSAISPPVGITS